MWSLFWWLKNERHNMSYIGIYINNIKNTLFISISILISIPFFVWPTSLYLWVYLFFLFFFFTFFCSIYIYLTVIYIFSSFSAFLHVFQNIWISLFLYTYFLYGLFFYISIGGMSKNDHKTWSGSISRIGCFLNDYC